MNDHVDDDNNEQLPIESLPDRPTARTEVAERSYESLVASLSRSEITDQERKISTEEKR